MKITKRKTKSGCTITIKAETEDDKKHLTDSLLSGALLRALNAKGQVPVSMELKQTVALPAQPDQPKEKGES